MSDTPRTDAQIIEATWPEAEVVAVGFARQLEREQALAHQRATRFELELDEARQTILTLRGDIHAERATNKVLLADVERLENAVSARPEALRSEVIDECAEAINKRTQQLCSDPEVCYQEHDTGATVINPRFSDHVEALDEAEAIVLALKTIPSPLRRKPGYMGDVNGPGCDPDVP